eukprot:464104-Hanusia_phi.AAC.6
MSSYYKIACDGQRSVNLIWDMLKEEYKFHDSFDMVRIRTGQDPLMGESFRIVLFLRVRMSDEVYQKIANASVWISNIRPKICADYEDLMQFERDEDGYINTMRYLRLVLNVEDDLDQNKDDRFVDYNDYRL